MVFSQKSSISKIRPHAGVMPYRHITECIKKFIMEQNLGPGDRLPSTRELAKGFGVSSPTLGRALRVLEQEGTIQRRHGLGVFVTDPVVHGEFAMVFRPQLLGPEPSPFFALFTKSLSEAIHRRDPRWMLRMHLGKFVDDEIDFPATLDLLEPHVLCRLRGVFSVNSLEDVGRSLLENNIPVVMFGKYEDAHCCYFKHMDVIRIGVRHLREVGCRNVGVLWASPRGAETEEKAAARLKKKLADIKGFIREQGFQVSDEWTSIPADYPSEQLGYELFMQMSGQRRLPDGLVVADEMMARGVLRATLVKGLTLPEDFKLVVQATKGVVVPYHIPVTSVELDYEELSREAVAMMDSLLKDFDADPSHVAIAPRLVKGETT